MYSFAQVAAQELGVPLSTIHVTETATDKVPNASPTAASASSALYCAAVMDACSQLSQRLGPFLKSKANGQPGQPTFSEAVKAAYMARVDLCAHGFHATPLITGGQHRSSSKIFAFLDRNFTITVTVIALLSHLMKDQLAISL